MPRFCANLKWLFTELSFLDRFDAAARAGFRAVEYASPYEHPSSEIRARLRACDMQQVLFNTPGGGASGMACIPSRRQEFRDSVRKALDYAADLDCGLVHLMAGIVPPDLNRDTAAAAYASSVAWAAEQVSSTDVRLVLEPINQQDVPGFFLRTQEEGAAIIEAIGRDRIGLQFDIYHCQVAQGDVTRRMETLMPLIAHMQLADVPGRNEPGTGEIAWNYVFRRIDALGYAGWVGCEYRPATETVAGLGWLKRFAG
ncbi:MAG TPA: TIM barrel protein [Acetobacteraceae bacterium]|nr:TIM barrel protein [Acetobacteraceae bacterium]